MNKWPEVGTGHCACVFQRKEEFGDAECIEHCAYHANMEQKRAELLTICEELAESAAYWSEYDVPLGIVERLNSAISKAKGGAA